MSLTNDEKIKLCILHAIKVFSEMGKPLQDDHEVAIAAQAFMWEKFKMVIPEK